MDKIWFKFKTNYRKMTGIIRDYNFQKLTSYFSDVYCTTIGIWKSETLLTFLSAARGLDDVLLINRSQLHIDVKNAQLKNVEIFIERKDMKMKELKEPKELNIEWKEIIIYETWGNNVFSSRNS